MTAQSPILICPVAALRHLPDAERDVIRRFLTEHIRGIGAENDKRWRRLWGQVMRAEPGEGFQLYRVEERSGPFHRRHRVILERLFQVQERYRLIDGLHDYLKVKTHFVTWGENRFGGPKPVPRSTAFPECSEDDMRSFHARVVDLLHDPYAQRHLFPQVRANDRQGMVDAVLAEQEEPT